MRKAYTHSQELYNIIRKLPAYVWASTIMAFGLTLLNQAGTITGGIPGIALLLSYLTDWLSIGQMLILLNIPFLIFGYKVYGLTYVIRVVVCMVLLAQITDLAIWGISDYIPALWDSVLYNIAVHAFAGVLFGLGMVIFLNNGGNPGGMVILFHWLYKKTGVSIGLFLALHDIMILLIGWLLIVSFTGFLYSSIAVIVLSVVIRLSKDKSGS